MLRVFENFMALMRKMSKYRPIYQSRNLFYSISVLVSSPKIAHQLGSDMNWQWLFQCNCSCVWTSSLVLREVELMHQVSVYQLQNTTEEKTNCVCGSGKQRPNTYITFGGVSFCRQGISKLWHVSLHVCQCFLKVDYHRKVFREIISTSVNISYRP